ncbi:MAG TPA: gliding motility protein GldM [Flavipsychrobacter sp.]|nr:gliding motility protein GldM [Flavipsychrobacter sp.]
MSLPKEPRQLMINLMYLVLTAMLALNVSSEILHAFKTINQSISSSNVSIQDKNKKLYDSFDEQENQTGQKERVKPFNDKAKQVRLAAQQMYDYLETWKARIIEQSGGYDDEGKTVIKREDDIDATTLLLVERKGGDSVKQRIIETRNLMLSAVSSNARSAFEKQLPLGIIEPSKSDNNPTADWKVGYFQSMPVMAAVTLLAKFQNDVRNSEAQIINQLAMEAGDVQVKFDEIKAIAVTENSYALAGQTVKAQILLAAYNKAVNPTVTASSGRVVVKDGVASWETTAAGVGMQTVRGTVSLDMGGRVERRDYTFQYMVGSTGASIQLDKMNVFYIGVPNPITVSAAGYSIEDISVNIPNASIAATGKGKWDVTVTTPGKVIASINAKTEKGVTSVGSMEIRVKTIPDPIAKVAGKSGGVLGAAIFRAQTGIPAVLENFDFDTKFVVTSFEFSWLPKRGEYQGPFNVNGAYFKGNQQVNQYQTTLAKPGDKVFIENIRAIGPDKRTRTLNSITLTLN